MAFWDSEMQIMPEASAEELAQHAVKLNVDNTMELLLRSEALKDAGSSRVRETSPAYELLEVAPTACL